MLDSFVMTCDWQIALRRGRSVCAVLAGALAACALPAWRAARVDPLRAVRAE